MELVQADREETASKRKRMKSVKMALGASSVQTNAEDADVYGVEFKTPYKKLRREGPCMPLRTVNDSRFETARLYSLRLVIARFCETTL